jgi:hypothetical protein
MKLCEAGKDIISIPLWINIKGAKDITKLGEGCVRGVFRKGSIFCHASF